MARSPFRLKMYVSRPWWARSPKRACKALFWARINRRGR